MALIVKGLSKKYEAQLAVDDLSFTIEKGSVVGFLGPNGAGKSTTLKMIAGFLAPDAGEVILNGISNQKDTIAFKKLIGYLPESNPLYEEMYVKEYFLFLVNSRNKVIGGLYYKVKSNLRVHLEWVVIMNKYQQRNYYQLR